jgi:hypothetical protein
MSSWPLRLGRSLIDLLRTIQDLEAVAVDLYLDWQHLNPASRFSPAVLIGHRAFS